MVCTGEAKIEGKALSPIDLMVTKPCENCFRDAAKNRLENGIINNRNVNSTIKRRQSKR